MKTPFAFVRPKSRGPGVWWGSLGLLVAASSGFAATELKIGSVTGVPGTTVSIPVSLNSDTPVLAAQFDLTTVSAALISDGALAASPVPALGIASREIRPGVRRVLIYTHTSQPLPVGVLVNVPISIAANAEAGTTPLTLDNVILSNAEFGRVPSTQVDGALTLTSGRTAEFKSALFDSAGIFHLELSASTGGSYRFEVSPDLKSWTPLITQPVVNGLVRIADTNSVNQTARFYRALSLP